MPKIFLFTGNLASNFLISAILLVYCTIWHFTETFKFPKHPFLDCKMYIDLICLLTFNNALIIRFIYNVITNA